MNLTGERLHLVVKFRTTNEYDQWVWVPSDPQDQNGLQFIFEPDEEGVLSYDDMPMAGNRCRILARTDSGRTWTTMWRDDFWLVPEVDAQGRHVYYADKVRTGVYRFAP